MIRLGIDFRDATAREPRGTGKTLARLVEHLLPLVPEWGVTLYTDREGPATMGPPATLRRIDIRGHRLNAWERLRLPWAAFQDRLDLLHCPSQTAPPVTPCPVVLTIHDLIPLRMNDGWNPRQIGTFRREVERSVQRARRIIAVSEFTRRDLLATFPIPKEKVSVVPWGVDQAPPSAMSEDAWRDLAERHGIRRPFFVAFGGEAPRKNVAGLLEALALFTRHVTADVQTVLVGVPERARARLTALAGELGLSKHAVPLGYVPEKVMWELLSRAEALVYPSLYEGFGMPVLEAMAAGAPVITSSVTSMPEIAGDAALLVDPREPRIVADAMRQCYLNDRVKAELRSRGLRRAATFTWERAAAETLHIYRLALNREGAE